MSLETIAQVLKKDDTEACKVRSGERKCSLTEFCDLLDAAGLKLVGKDRHCVDEQTFQYMTRIVSKAMGNQQVAQTLIWEDD